ncbi:hypothetical protein HPL003_19330 [Paenibacillus terrae HPL-003]|uniref:Uncharacterized protein n=1 Tax=Paenibacillus terrae (strain HPL-003) TaxID=985665 RepID=G7W2V0_PAETH|nr:hypothetical protein [Paenibacillus terrae]AET60606.1 hypothetical protein HPL003_19330 [Paenibacillus terrae HPL-003]
MLTKKAADHGGIVLAGFESSGKSALFRGLSGQDTGEESNFRGSTVMTRRALVEDGGFKVI